MQTQWEASKNKVGKSYIFWCFANKQKNQENIYNRAQNKTQKEKEKQGNMFMRPTTRWNCQYDLIFPHQRREVKIMLAASTGYGAWWIIIYLYGNKKNKCYSWKVLMIYETGNWRLWVCLLGFGMTKRLGRGTIIYSSVQG